MPDTDEALVLAKLGGDPRVLELFGLALVAYKYLPAQMFNFTTGEPTREWIIQTIESFGFRAAPIPWSRFPKRFHKNKPTLQLFKPELTDAEIEQHWVDLIAAQSPTSGRRATPQKGPAQPPDGGGARQPKRKVLK